MIKKYFTFTKKAMSYWKTRMRIHTEGKTVETEYFEYNVEYFKETHHHCYLALT
jgi:hypothetical protein